MSEQRRPRRASRLLWRRSAPHQSPPGTLAPSPFALPPHITVFSFDANSFSEECVTNADGLGDLCPPDRTHWVDVQGLGDEMTLREIGGIFGLHPLALADAVNLGQRPKCDPYDDTLFAVARMVRPAEDGELIDDQISMALRRNVVITFQDTYGDTLDSLRERIRRGRGIIRSQRSDYLFCAVLETIIDGYFPLLETLGERLDDIERRVLDRPDDATLAAIFGAKRDLMMVRRAAWPMREMLASIQRERSPLISQKVIPYLRDATDHAVHVVDVAETYRELAQSFVDVYLSSVSQRTNEIMRVLTVISTIFIPLTFLAGVYGMNFHRSEQARLNMPELDWKYGYVLFWALCAMVAFIQLFFFFRAGWLGPPPRARAARAARAQREPRR